MYHRYLVALQQKYQNKIKIMKILSARQFNGSLKVTVQQTGKMNFSDETANVLDLTDSKRAKFFLDGEPEQLFMAIVEEQDEDAFKIRKSGAYYYVPAQRLFDELGVDYKTNTVIYDLVRCKSFDEEAGGQCYRMDYRPIPKKKKDKDDKGD